jgi:fructose-1-phosphate kinase PfkB-like protein
MNEINPFGCGDSMIAGILCGLVQSMPFHEAVKLGVALGSANSIRTDVANVPLHEAQQYLDKVIVE